MKRFPILKLYLTVFACLCVFSSARAEAYTDAAKATEEAMPLPFSNSEQLIYEAEFSRFVLRGIQIAEIRFTAQKKDVPSSAIAKVENAITKVENNLATDAFDFSVEATSKSWFQKLFNLTFRFSIKSFVEAKNFVVARTFKIDEQGSRRRESEAVFDRTQNLLTWTERNPNDSQAEPRVVRTPLEGATQDLASVFYFLRTQPLADGAKIEISLSDSGRVYQVPVSVAGRKRIKTSRGSFSTIEVNADMFGENRPLQGKGKFIIWFTDDARRLPVKAKITTDAGTVDVHLKKVVKDGKAESSVR